MLSKAKRQKDVKKFMIRQNKKGMPRSDVRDMPFSYLSPSDAEWWTTMGNVSIALF